MESPGLPRFGIVSRSTRGGGTLAGEKLDQKSLKAGVARLMIASPGIYSVRACLSRTLVKCTVYDMVSFTAVHGR